MVFGRLFARRAVPETVAAKQVRMLGVYRELAASSSAIIAQARQAGDVALTLSNYSHLIGDLGSLAVLLWRLGEDPRTVICEAHDAHDAMIAFRDLADPAHGLTMGQISGITDWDQIYTLFWLTGRSVEPVFHHPHLLAQRYFAYSRWQLLRLTGRPQPDDLAATVERFRTRHDELVDRHFADLVALLDGLPDGEAACAVARRVAESWSRRRRSAFYQASTPVNAGFDAANDLSIDHQLAAALHRRGLDCPAGPHRWQWG